MSHFLTTRYTLKDEFGLNKALGKIQELVKKLAEEKAIIDNKKKYKRR